MPTAAVAPRLHGVGAVTEACQELVDVPAAETTRPRDDRVELDDHPRSGCHCDGSSAKCRQFATLDIELDPVYAPFADDSINVRDAHLHAVARPVHLRQVVVLTARERRCPRMF